MEPRWGVALTICLALLATGCLYQPPDTAVKHSPSPSAVHEGAQPGGPYNPPAGFTPTPSATTTPPANHAPYGVLSASAVKGPIPFNVTFTITGRDPDHEKFWWYFDAGFGQVESGNSDELPFTVPFNYTAVGNFTAKLRVTDHSAMTESRVGIYATPKPHVPIQQVSGSYWAGTPDVCSGNDNVNSVPDSTNSTGLGSPVGSTGYYRFPVNAKTMKAHFHADFNYTGKVTQLYVNFFDSGNNGLPVPHGERSGPTWVDGEVPVDAGYADLASCGGAAVTVTYYAG